MIREVQLFDDSVISRTIAADIVAAADIAAAGVGTSELASQGVTGAKASTAAFLQVGRVNSAPTSSSIIEFGTNMTATPKVFLSIVAADASGTTANTVSASTAEFHLIVSHASTVDFIAVANVTGPTI